MQTVTMYLRATSVKATLVDEWNQTVSVLPALTRPKINTSKQTTTVCIHLFMCFVSF